jgi:SAM-dependent methyltransferase
MQEIEFEKYEKQGAYHWRDTFHPIYGNAAGQARYDRCLTLLREALDGLTGKRILDFGCGDGVLSFMLFRKGAVAFGIDVSEIAIRFAKKIYRSKNANVNLLVGSCYDTGFEDNYFDGVVSSDVIEHVRDTDRFLAELRRILKPGGKAVISTPIRLKNGPLDEMHVHEWFEEDFNELISQYFPQSRFFVSHPIFWTELQNRIGFLKFVFHLLPRFVNPFLQDKKWRSFTMQYAVSRKNA